MSWSPRRIVRIRRSMIFREIAALFVARICWEVSWQKQTQSQESHIFQFESDGFREGRFGSVPRT